MKQLFLSLCLLAYKQEPADWEWEVAMAETKRRYPRSGVNRNVFENKWLNDAKDQIWKHLTKDFKGIVEKREVKFTKQLK